jgi:hypothetical protein
MIVTILRQQPRAAALVLALIAANLLAWAGRGRRLATAAR